MGQRKFRRITFILGGALMLLIAGFITALCWPREGPIVLTVMGLRPTGILDYDFLKADESNRVDAAEISGLETVSMAMSGRATTDELSEFSVSPEFESRSNGRWVKASGAILLPNMQSDQSRAGSYHVVCLMPKGAEACRIRVDYYSGLPLGIGNPVARELPPSRASEWAQKGVRAASQSLYRRLWPQSRCWDMCLKTTVVEVPLPKGYKADESLFPDF